MRAVYLVRHDLRWQDHQTLLAFCAQASEGIVVWCETRSFQRATEEIAEEALIDLLPTKIFKFDQGSLIRVQDLPMCIKKWHSTG